MSDKVPLVVYDGLGNRKIVGTAEVDGNKISGTITDQHLADIISDKSLRGLSISAESAVPTHPSLFNEALPPQKDAIDPFGLTSRKEERHLPNHNS